MDSIFIHLLLSIHYRTEEVTSVKLISLQTGIHHLISKKKAKADQTIEYKKM
jgi:hypothetical protein